ncbi:MAG: hypothetical protein H0X62_08985 [Bacteroidetes bacterium]|nr:hypothetical protein [Bacteroidota bacterium]
MAEIFKMKPLYLLIQGLNKREINLVISYLKSQVTGTDSKLFLLFELLLNSKELPDANAISMEFYQKEKDNALEKLSSRLNSRILDVIISQANNEESKLEHFDLISISIRKKLTQFYQLYYSRGNYDLVSINLLTEVISKAKKYELYSPLIEALQFDKLFRGFSKGFEEFNKVHEEIEFYNKCLAACYRAIDLYFQMTMFQNFEANNNQKKLNDFLKSSIKELKIAFKETGSAIVGYYLKQLELSFFSNKEDFYSSRRICNELVFLLEKSKSIFLKKRIAFALANLAKCEVYLNEYDNAIKNSNEAQRYIHKNEINYILSKEVELHALFYNYQISDSKLLVESILAINQLNERDPFRFSKFLLYNAYILFKQKNYKEALKILNQNLEISKDKLGWEIIIRVLKIWCLIELEDETTEMQIYAFRKHVKRHTPKEIGRRNIIIVDFLYDLMKSKFDFNKCNALETIELLSSNQKNVKWEHLTPELIPFQDWISQKISVIKLSRPLENA